MTSWIHSYFTAKSPLFHLHPFAGTVNSQYGRDDQTTCRLDDRGLGGSVSDMPTNEMVRRLMNRDSRYIVAAGTEQEDHRDGDTFDQHRGSPILPAGKCKGNPAIPGMLQDSLRPCLSELRNVDPGISTPPGCLSPYAAQHIVRRWFVIAA